MKIGIMLRHYEQHDGGVKVYTQNLIPRLLSQGSCNQYLLIYRNPALLGSYAGYPNASEIVLSVPTRLLWDQIGVSWIARKYKLDLVFNPKFTAPAFAGTKTVFVRHGSERYVIPEKLPAFNCWASNLLIRQSCRSADAVICVSETVRKDLIAFTGLPAQKASLIHNGFDDHRFRVTSDTARLAEIRKKYALPERFILWAGQIDPRKNIARLLMAFDKIRHSVPHDLVLAGLKGWKAEEELRPIHQLDLQGRVHFTGWVPHDDLPLLYNLADLFVFPSLYEGFGLPLVEAMACGCPVLTADRGSPPEITGKAAFLVNPLDVDQLARGMRSLLTDQSARNDLKTKGLERAKAFSWNHCAEQVLALFDRVHTGELSARETRPRSKRKAVSPSGLSSGLAGKG
jgi:glycosyltransferase involved in cell wall biosynthesis